MFICVYVLYVYEMYLYAYVYNQRASLRLNQSINPSYESTIYGYI